jgi:parallel beta-helix repeat protein
MLRPHARSLLAAVLPIVLAASPAGARTLTVNDAGADCAVPADHTTIQAAVTAAAADRVTRIHVCPGTYAELVRIEGFRRLTLEADPGALVVPPGPVATGGIIEVVDSRKVDVRGFEIDGAGQFSGPSLYVYGVYYRDSSGSIEGNTISGIRPEPLEQSFAHAIQVLDADPADDVSVKIRIRGNRLEDYGQMGIEVDGAVSVRIEDNVLTGIGPTAATVQLGAIVRSTQKGRVTGNEFSGHWFTPFRAGTGLYLEEASRIRVERNVFDANDNGIHASGAAHRNRIADNDVTGSRFAVSVDGLADTPAERNQVTGNRLGGAPGTGVTAVSISNAARTLVSRNETAAFAAFLDDTGTETRLSKNSCDGAPCP